MDLKIVEAIEKEDLRRNFEVNNPMERNNKTWRLPLYPGTMEKIQSSKNTESRTKEN